MGGQWLRFVRDKGLAAKHCRVWGQHLGMHADLKLPHMCKYRNICLGVLLLARVAMELALTNSDPKVGKIAGWQTPSRFRVEILNYRVEGLGI